MHRSVWKIPLVIRGRRSMEDDKPANITSRAAVIEPKWIGQIIHIHNGYKYIPIKVTESFVGYKFGSFALTKKRVFHKKKKKK